MIGKWMLLGLLGACTTYPQLRPADTLPQGKVELGGGMAMSTAPSIVLQGAYGVSDDFEVMGHFETTSNYGLLRYGILSSEQHPVAFSLSAGAGVAQLTEDFIEDFNEQLFSGESTTTSSPPESLLQLIAGLSLGKRFRWFEPYMGYRIHHAPSRPSSIHSLKAGARFHMGKWALLVVEGGANAFHLNTGGEREVAWFPEGAVAFGFHFDAEPGSNSEEVAPYPETTPSPVEEPTHWTTDQSQP